MTPGVYYPGFSHEVGDDHRAWSYYDYFVEANFTQEQWGSIPGYSVILSSVIGRYNNKPVIMDTHQTSGPSFQLHYGAILQ